MRRPLNWLVVLLSVVVVFVGMSLPGCGGGGGATGEDPPLASGMLRQVRDPRSSRTRSSAPSPRPSRRVFRTGPSRFPTVPTADFSGTYTVEAGVDELDVVRYDGTHLYRRAHCTSIAAVDAAIRILRTDAASATATQVGSIPLEDPQMRAGHVRRGRSPVPGHQPKRTLVHTATSGPRCSCGRRRNSQSRCTTCATRRARASSCPRRSMACSSRAGASETAWCW